MREELKSMCEALKLLRHSYGYSQRKAAEMSGLTQKQIFNIENCKTDFTLKSYLMYKSIFKLS